MKKHFILIFMLFINTFVFSQNLSGKITYVVSMEPITDKTLDSISKKNGKEKMSQFARSLFKNSSNVNGYLEFANGESLYTVEAKMQVDDKSKLNLARIIAGGDDKTYKNTKTKEYLKEIPRERLLVELKEKEWQITQESKQIGNYLCYKAIDIVSKNKNKKPIVWFTPQIPVSFGPKEYTGLPGLVILVEMSNITISASKIILNPQEKISIYKPIKGQRISEEKFLEGLKSSMKFRKKKS